MEANYYRWEIWFRIHWRMVEYVADSRDLRRNEGCFMFHSVVSIWGVLLHHVSMPDSDKGIFIAHILLFFIICLNYYTTILDWCLPWYASMSLMVIEEIVYVFSWNTTRTISGMKISTARDTTNTFRVCDLANSVNRRPASHTAPVLIPIELFL